jgi:hypothetical protein
LIGGGERERKRESEGKRERAEKNDEAHFLLLLLLRFFLFLSFFCFLFWAPFLLVLPFQPLQVSLNEHDGLVDARIGPGKHDKGGLDGAARNNIIVALFLLTLEFHQHNPLFSHTLFLLLFSNKTKWRITGSTETPGLQAGWKRESSGWRESREEGEREKKKSASSCFGAAGEREEFRFFSLLFSSFSESVVDMRRRIQKKPPRTGQLRFIICSSLHTRAQRRSIRASVRDWRAGDAQLRG